MVALSFGDRADAVDEGERVGEVRELVILREVMLLDRFPSVELSEERCDLFTAKARHAAVAGHAVSARKTLQLQNLHCSSGSVRAPARAVRLLKSPRTRRGCVAGHFDRGILHAARRSCTARWGVERRARESAESAERSVRRAQSGCA